MYVTSPSGVKTTDPFDGSVKPVTATLFGSSNSSFSKTSTVIAVSSGVDAVFGTISATGVTVTVIVVWLVKSPSKSLTTYGTTASPIKSAAGVNVTIPVPSTAQSPSLVDSVFWIPGVDGSKSTVVLSIPLSGSISLLIISKVIGVSSGVVSLSAVATGIILLHSAGAVKVFALVNVHAVPLENVAVKDRFDPFAGNTTSWNVCDELLSKPLTGTVATPAPFKSKLPIACGPEKVTVMSAVKVSSEALPAVLLSIQDVISLAVILVMLHGVTAKLVFNSSGQPNRPGWDIITL